MDALLAIKRPTSISELRSFIGAVTDMSPRRSHLLAPLTAQAGKCTLKWTSECDKSFNAIKALLAEEAFLQFPDHNKPFHICTDASDRQMGSVILQEGKPVAFFSRKLNPAQRNYTTGEKELLSIVETLKEYRTILFGCQYGPIFHYIKGEHNTTADAFSRLSFSERQSTRFPRKPFDVTNPSASDFPEVTGEDFPVVVDFPVEVKFDHFPVEVDFPVEVRNNFPAEVDTFYPSASDFPEVTGEDFPVEVDFPVKVKFDHFPVEVDFPVEVRNNFPAEVDTFYTMVTDDLDLCDCFVHLPDQ
ncbi:hypothetical protein IV203_015278 [Nitzschia inconspicua]|uniref:Reverse transcriptase/retrotransposon-derived protein RNase H-like domain-containing protein n=1 Tax=Nitzschia inconspicua TaxID=303405 RepID=A0A9K3LBJ4_9STRA|nr:hypothetical protein IV203_020233 [Nitzschia inconspicua]KAG7358689.1 hypothetical protein IV203_015278 [Nitzschia inconspicua]